MVWVCVETSSSPRADSPSLADSSVSMGAMGTMAMFSSTISGKGCGRHSRAGCIWPGRPCADESPTPISCSHAPDQHFSVAWSSPAPGHGQGRAASKMLCLGRVATALVYWHSSGGVRLTYTHRRQWPLSARFGGRKSERDGSRVQPRNCLRKRSQSLKLPTGGPRLRGNFRLLALRAGRAPCDGEDGEWTMRRVIMQALHRNNN